MNEHRFIADYRILCWFRLLVFGAALYAVLQVKGNPALTVRLDNAGNTTINIRFTNPDYCFNCVPENQEFDTGISSTMGPESTLERFLGSQAWRQGDTVNVFWKFDGIEMDWISACSYAVPFTESDVSLPSPEGYCLVGVDTYIYYCLTLENITGKPMSYIAFGGPTSSAVEGLVPAFERVSLQSGQTHTFQFTLPGHVLPPGIDGQPGEAISFTLQTVEGQFPPLYTAITPTNVTWHGNSEQNVTCDFISHGSYFWQSTNESTRASALAQAPVLPDPRTNAGGLVYPTNWDGGTELVKEYTFMRAAEALFGQAEQSGAGLAAAMEILGDRQATNTIRLLTSLEGIRTNGLSLTNTDRILTNIEDRLTVMTNYSAGGMGTNSEAVGVLGYGASNELTVALGQVQAAGASVSFGTPSSSFWTVEINGQSVNLNPMAIEGMSSIAGWAKVALTWMLKLGLWIFLYWRFGTWLDRFVRTPSKGTGVADIASGGLVWVATRAVIAAAGVALAVIYHNALTDNSAMLAGAFTNPFDGITEEFMLEGFKILNAFIPIEFFWSALIVALVYEVSMAIAWIVAAAIVKFMAAIAIGFFVASASGITFEIKNATRGEVIWQVQGPGTNPTNGGTFLYCGPTSIVEADVSFDTVVQGNTMKIWTRFPGGSWVDMFGAVGWGDFESLDADFGEAFVDDMKISASVTEDAGQTITLYGLSATKGGWYGFDQGWKLGVMLFGAGLGIWVVKRLVNVSGDI